MTIDRNDRLSPTAIPVGRPAMTTLNSARLTRRLALLLPLAAGGCSLFDGDWFDTQKVPLPGTRVPVLHVSRGLVVDNPRNLRVALPTPVTRTAWAQPGGTPAHEMGHAMVADRLAEAWRSDIGEGGGYRRKITAQPVIADGRVFAMDSEALVSAFDATSGNRIWRFDTTPEDNDSTNVGGGVSVDGGVLYATTGYGEILALDAATGALKWRHMLGSPARAAPTVADGKLFIPLLGDRLAAHAADDGRRLWSYQASQSQTSVLGLPSPAYADGFIVAGFSSGELVALRAATGAVVWVDSLASGHGRGSSSDLSAIHGMPVIQDGRVYAVGLGGLLLALDLRSGRRLWERDVASADTPCVAGDWIYVLSTDSEVAALSRLDGSVAWVTQLQKFDDEKKKKDQIEWMGPLLAADRLVVASSNAQALAVSPYTGEILGQQQLSGPVSVPPVVALGTVFMVTDDARLLALR
jgi:outer membrane protein assembly factor BamB